MKLTELFSRAQRPSLGTDEINAPLRAADDRTDRSSMAELVRLLQQADEPRGERGERPS